MTKKLTKRQMFAQIKDKYPLTEAEVAFIDHEIDLLEKKNTSGERKPTATQKANEGIKESILVVLEDGEKKTVTDIVKAIDGEYTNQKISALMRQLVEDNKVEKIVEKRKSYFKIA